MNVMTNRLMKKIVIGITVLLLFFTLAGCKDNKADLSEVEVQLYDAIDALLDEEYKGDERDMLIRVTMESIVASADTNYVFYEVLDELRNNHFSQTEREELMLGAIEGMVDILDDPFTRYFDLEEAQQYQSNFAETYIGIGVTVRFEDNQIVIEAVKEDGPADQAGIRVGDVITYVDGEKVSDSFYETINLILGEEGTEVIIGVFRPGFEDTLYFPMNRAEIDNSSVESELFELEGQKVGYIKVTQFGDETSLKFQVAVMNLENQGIDSLIVDLRDNGGGRLDTVYEMLSEFLIDDGNPMFSTERYVNQELYTTDYLSSNDERKAYNIVTLVNENSASASEVFASAMNEHGGYPVIGVTTYGKGTMQYTLPIISTLGDELHITVGRWLTADGNWVHYDGGTDGFVPDIISEKTDIENAYKVYLIDENPIPYDTVDSRVENIQIILNYMGYEVRTDGYYDINTKNAIIDIQSTNELTETGDMNQDTLDYINAFLQQYLSDAANDTQLQTSISYLLEHPEDPNE